ncbi:MAG: translation elongation factor 4 [Parcubacteria group bacterium]
MDSIRNFVIIAHIDHGKSTLADRMLEITETVQPRQMKPQYLDQMELERERGITIKMTPVRMAYNLNGKKYELNLIDTPGHSDFGYEVSRALTAVEGAVLLVDATQGLQAQTIANYEAAKKAGLKIIGCVNKIDLNPPGIEEVVKELARLIHESPENIYRVSAKTGEGLGELMEGIIRFTPPPSPPAGGNPPAHGGKQALIFDSVYDDHKGIIAYVRIFSGSFKSKESSKLVGADKQFMAKEIGMFVPNPKPVEELAEGEIGYIATGIKDPGVLRIGDTIGDNPLPGFTPPNPVVFVSIYPSDGGEYDDLKSALNKLRLMDSSVTLAPDHSEVLGRGFKAGFLGRLHFEIVTARLEREFGLKVVTSFPSVAYKLITRTGERVIESPKDFPEEYIKAEEPIVALKIMTPKEYLGRVMSLRDFFRMSEEETDSFEDRIIISAKMPLAELVSDFDDKLKSVSLGYASFSYEFFGYAPASLTKLEVVLAGEEIPGLTRIVYKEDAPRIARKLAEDLKNLLPRALFVQSIQVKDSSRILAREDIPALKKDVTGYLYGGDRTRKVKLWEKQKKGKKKLKERGKVTIAPEVFKELLKK